MDRWRGRWALVTGASAGIGREIARQLAAGGVNLVLTARRRDRLAELASELQRDHSVRTELCVADLAQSIAPEEIFRFTQEKGIEVELLVNNAGFGTYGEFHAQPIERLQEMVQVNVTAVLHLTHLFLPHMIARRRGDVLILSSTAGFQAIPYMATYAATKSFELIWGEALAWETRRYGVRVCVFCPGTTTTEFQQVAGSPHNPLRVPESAETVARNALRAMAAGKRMAISGARNWLGAQAQRVLPRATIARITAKLFEEQEKG